MPVPYPPLQYDSVWEDTEGNVYYRYKVFYDEDSYDDVTDMYDKHGNFVDSW